MTSAIGAGAETAVSLLKAGKPTIEKAIPDAFPALRGNGELLQKRAVATGWPQAEPPYKGEFVATKQQGQYLSDVTYPNVYGHDIAPVKFSTGGADTYGRLVADDKEIAVQLGEHNTKYVLGANGKVDTVRLTRDGETFERTPSQKDLQAVADFEDAFVSHKMDGSNWATERAKPATYFK